MDPESTKDDQGNPSPPDDRVELKIFSDPNSAELARGNLEAHGIECWLTADDCGGMLAAMDTVRGVKLFVRRSDSDAANALLASVPGDASQPAADEPPLTGPAVKDSSPRIKLSLPQIATGIVVGVLLCLLYQWTAKLGTKTYRYDSDQDGKYDEIIIERNGRTIEWARDRNFDGAMDNWVYYDDNGMQSRAEADDNFDSRPDLFWTITNNVTAASWQDTDFNGAPDVTTTFLHDLPTQADWQPNGTNIVTLRQLFRHGGLTEEQRDTNWDGSFDVTIHYDAFQNPIGTNVFKLLSPTSR